MTKLMVAGASLLVLLVRADGDLDRDGIDDALEQRLLEQFLPTFWLDSRECAGLPAEFQGDASRLEVAGRNGTLYGRVAPSRALGAEGEALELQYFHLWDEDCGPISPHALDVEHVTALVSPNGTSYEARYWYAAAHEKTVCDTSNAARAESIGAVSRGPDVWIAVGKHASYLHPDLCNQRGCGVDSCGRMERLSPTPLVNLGEPDAPLSGASWISFDGWPLRAKLRSDFDDELVAALRADSTTVLARVNGGFRPTQFSLSVGGDLLGALGQAQRHGGGSVALAEQSTERGVRKALHAVGGALKSVASALGLH